MKSTNKKSVRKPVKKTAVAIIKPQSSTLSLASPNDVMAFGNVLKEFIVKNSLSVKIANGDYAMVDAWKYAGLNFGLTAIPGKPVRTSIDGEYITTLYGAKEFKKRDGTKYVKEVAIFSGYSRHKEMIAQIKAETEITREFTKPYFAYECDCEIQKLSNHERVTRGTGFCSNLELLKSGFDEYSVISMSETRSIGKGYRNLIGFVMKAAGIEPTPAEEMQDEFTNQEPKQQAPTLPKVTQTQLNQISGRIVLKSTKEEMEGVITEAQKHFYLSPDQMTELNKTIKMTLNAKGHKTTKAPAGDQGSF